MADKPRQQRKLHHITRDIGRLIWCAVGAATGIGLALWFVRGPASPFLLALLGGSTVFLFGITGLAAILLQGASYAVMKTEGELQKRSFRAVSILMWINLITAIAYFLTMAVTLPGLASNGLFYVAVLCTLLGLAGIFFSVKKRNDTAAFWESSFSFIGLWLAAGVAQFPNLIKATNAPDLSITIFNSSTSLQTLKLMSVIALIGMPNLFTGHY